MVEVAVMLRRAWGAEGPSGDDPGHSEVPVCG